MSLKYSRQRQAIWEFVRNRDDHPTADTIYVNVRKSYPNISLGTVYRNLMLLKKLGRLRTIETGGGVVRFDPKTEDHAHFICKSCGSISDLSFDYDNILVSASDNCSGRITGYDAFFYGICEKCAAAGITEESLAAQDLTKESSSKN